MYDTTIMLKPREQWRPGMTYDKLIREMDEKLQFPGLTNTWTMPVENRLDMELTGIKTPSASRSRGRICDADSGHRRTDAAGRFQPCPRQFRLCRARLAGLLSQCGSEPAAAARYGLTVADVQRVVTSEIGGMDIAENIEGRQRFPDRSPLPARLPRHLE